MRTFRMHAANALPIEAARLRSRLKQRSGQGLGFGVRVQGFGFGIGVLGSESNPETKLRT